MWKKIQPRNLDQMTPEETKQAAAVMIAWAKGKPIQSRAVLRTDLEWTTFEPGHRPPVWDWEDYDYRIAPEPMEVEVWVHPDGMIAQRGLSGDAHMTRHGYTLRRATIHVEEVQP
jgi:hypothetical protein